MPIERSAGAVVFHKRGRKIEYLLLQYELGHWDFPKGHIEKGETEKDAASREITEETGIKDIIFLPGFQKEVKYFFKKNKKTILKTVIFYLAETKAKKVKISFEHTGYEWLSHSLALKKLTFANAKEILKSANNFLDKIIDRNRTFN